MISNLQIHANIEFKLAAVKAFAALLEETSLDKITVNDICVRASISRSAFYRNFENKYSVAQWHLCYVHSQSTNLIGRTFSFYNGYLLAEMMFSQYQHFYECISQKQVYSSLSQFSNQTRKEALIETLREFHHQNITPRLLFDIEALVAIESAMLPQWRSDEVSLEDKCKWMVELVPRPLIRLLDAPSNPSTIS